MGDYAEGEFAVAGKVAGSDYDCLPGLGIHPMIDAGGDAFYFPKSDDPAVTAAQLKMASMLISKPVQVAFNLKKGSVPIRADVDLEKANLCMKIGLNILESPTNILPYPGQVMERETLDQIGELYNAFFADHEMTVDQVQAKLVDIIENAS